MYQPEDAPPSILRLVNDLMPLLIEGEHPALVALREQYRRASVEYVELTGVGFFVGFKIPTDAPLASPSDFAGGNALITLKGARYGAGCVLFVRDGRLSRLEGFTFEDDWPEDAEVISIENVVPIKPV